MKTRCFAGLLLALAAALTACSPSSTGVDEDLSQPTMPSSDMADHEMAEPMDMADHETPDHGGHEHGQPVDLTGLASRPEVSLLAEADGSGGIMLDIEVLGLELVPADPPVDHRPGQGHVHVAVDGLPVAMIADTSYHVAGLTNGSHAVTVTLSSNDHRDYHADGSAISATADVQVTGGAPLVEPDVRFEVDVAGGTIGGGLQRFEASVGQLVEVTVRSDVADDVHLHVYDLKVAVHERMPAVLLVEVDIPGVFEAELHTAGFKIFELAVS
jgi:hypothetical protein